MLKILFECLSKATLRSVRDSNHTEADTDFTFDQSNTSNVYILDNKEKTKLKWPLSYIPPEHLRLSKYKYP